MTPEYRAYLLQHTLEGLWLRLLEAGGWEYFEGGEEYAGAGYHPHKVTPEDCTLSESGTEVEITYTWTFTGKGRDAVGCRATRRDLTVIEGRFPKPFEVRIAGTKITGKVTLALEG